MAIKQVTIENPKLLGMIACYRNSCFPTVAATHGSEGLFI